MKEWAISDAGAPGLYLGAQSWTRAKPASLRFADQHAADAWLAELRRAGSPLIRGRKVATVEINVADAEDGFAHDPRDVRSDWDPFGIDP